MKVSEYTARKADLYILPDGRAPSGAEPGKSGITSADADEIARLASLSLLDYEFERFSAAERIGCRRSVLDRAVADYRKAKAAEVPMAAPEPWPDPVDGLDLLNRIAAAILRFVVLPEHAAEAAALWVMHAHALDAFQFSPLLLLTSPEKRCGKTTALRVLSKLVPRPISAANLTPSAMFRTIQSIQPTIFLDEADTFLNRSTDLRAIINAGYGRDDAFIMRTIGGEPRAFSVWCPKVIAGIGRRAGTVEDRAIIVRLRRKLPTEEVEAFRSDRADEFKDLCRQAARWASDNLEALRAADPDTPPELHDRAADSWRPLLALADLAGGDWPQIGRQAAIALSGGEIDDPTDTPGMQLLGETRRVFAEHGGELMTPTDLVKALGRLDEAAFGRGKPLSPKALSNLLRPYGIKSKEPARLPGRRQARYYFRGDFEDAWARYLPPPDPVPSVPSVPSSKISGLAESPGSSVTDVDGEKTFKISDITDGTDQAIVLDGVRMKETP